MRLNNEQEERNSTLQTKECLFLLGSCPPQVITAARQGQKKKKRPQSQDMMMKP